jgi:hypothetical protein
MMTPAEINDDDRTTLLQDRRYGERIAQATEKLLSRFISYPSIHCRSAHALWILHTHVLRHFDSTPRLAFLSPEPASGKTRALEITELLVPNPVSAVNVSPSYLFRKIGGDDEDKTILFDEIDTVFGPKAKENEEIRGLLNAGHRRGAVAGRCVVRGKNIETEEISAFAPVALAGLGWLPDTILSRSVVIRMQRRAAGEVIEPFRRRVHGADADSVRFMIEAWAKSAWEDGLAWPDLPAEIQDRDADVWEPLIAIADAVGGDWPAKAREAAVTLVTASKDREPSLGIRLLADLERAFANREEMQTATILEALIGMDESPWGDLRGKPLDVRGLAQRLRQYDVKPKTIWFGSKQAKGYTRADLKQPWARYLHSTPGTSVTSVTPANVEISPAAFALSDNVTDVTDVTDVTRLADRREEIILSRRHKCWHCQQFGETVEVSRGATNARLHRDCIDAWTRDYDEQNAGLPAINRAAE